MSRYAASDEITLKQWVTFKMGSYENSQSLNADYLELLLLSGLIARPPENLAGFSVRRYVGNSLGFLEELLEKDLILPGVARALALELRFRLNTTGAFSSIYSSDDLKPRVLKLKAALER